MTDYDPGSHKSSRTAETTDAAYSEALRGMAQREAMQRLRPELLQLAERFKIPELTFKARYVAGACVGCGSPQCRSCGADQALWCEVCWDNLHAQAPEGMVVSGLHQIMQLLTRNGQRPS